VKENGHQITGYKKER